ncbi:MAG TPA: ester cyclase [Actinomycetota bacterium]|nr:ester cyclase [Actinomycetota bacterium]
MNASNEEIVRRYFDQVWEQGDSATIDRLLSLSFVDHDAPPGFGTDRESHKRLVALMLDTMYNKHHRILAMVSDGEVIAVRHDMEWTQKADFFGISASGKRLTMKGLDMYRVRDGQIVESWHCEDVAGVMRQAGPSS